jgi:O-acetyl-ADP-ribose deacetylase (regulator of RNase III)
VQEGFLPLDIKAKLSEKQFVKRDRIQVEVQGENMMESKAEPHRVVVEAIDADITALKVDAIVNSANTEMRLGGSRSIAGTIARKTKGKVQRDLDNDRKYPKPVQLGQIAVTKGFDLPCKFIFHLATHGGWTQGTEKDAELLKAISDGIVNSIKKAEELSLHTLAIPLIATGSLRLPMGLAIETHINALSHALTQESFLHLEKIVLVSHMNPWVLNHIKHLLSNINIQTHTQRTGSFDCSMADQGFPEHEDSFCCELDLKELEKLQLRKSGYLPEVDGLELENLNLDTSDRETTVSLDTISLMLEDGIHKGLGYPEKTVMLGLELAEARRQIKNLQEELRVALERITLLSGPENGPATGALPVAYAYNMVESEISPMLKMERLRRALGIVLRYFASLVFADYHASGCFENAVNEQCIRAFSRPATDGDWLNETENVASAYLTHSVIPVVINEIPGLWKKDQKNKSKFAGLCHSLVRLRNEIHEKTAFDESTAGEWLERALPIWHRMLKEGAPFLKYELFFMEGIDDFTSTDEIVYQVRWLMGQHLIPRSELVQWGERLQKGKLYVRNPVAGKSLNLSPFMAYEYSSITKTRETYCIEQIAKGKLSFATLRFPHKEDLPGYESNIFKRHNQSRVPLRGVGRNRQSN